MSILNKSTFPLVSLMTVLLFAFVSTAVQAGPPGKPQNVSASEDQMTNTITLTWDAPTDNPGSPIIGYEIVQFGPYEGNTPPNSPLGLDLVKVTYTDITATKFTTPPFPSKTSGDPRWYWFVVAAVNADRKYHAEPVREMMPNDAFGPPTNIQTEVLSGEQQTDGSFKYPVKLTWTAPNPAPGLASYTIIQTGQATALTRHTSYTTPALAAGTYQFTIVGVAGPNYGAPWDGEVTVNAQPAITPPSPPVSQASAPVFHTSLDDSTPLTTAEFTVYQGGQGGIVLCPYDADGGEITLSVARPRFATSVSKQVFTIDEAVDLTLPKAPYDAGTEPVTYTLTPDLPDGLTFNARTRKITGTPTATFSETTYTYTARNPDLPNNRTADASLTFTITVEDPPPVEEAASETEELTPEHIVSSQQRILQQEDQTQQPTNPPNSAPAEDTQQPPPENPPENTQQPQQPVQQNRAPVFTDGDSTTRRISEDAGSGTNIGAVVSATDADNDTLTYTLGGTDATSFSIDSTSGQLRTSATLDYETRTSYSVTVSVSDGNGGTDSITVTINVIDVAEGGSQPPQQQPPQPTNPPENTQQPQTEDTETEPEDTKEDTQTTAPVNPPPTSQPDDTQQPQTEDTETEPEDTEEEIQTTAPVNPPPTSQQPPPPEDTQQPPPEDTEKETQTTAPVHPPPTSQPTGGGGGGGGASRRNTVTRTTVPYSPIVINEIGNNEADAHDWVELRNVTDTEVDLENYELTQIVSKNSETTLVAFPQGKGAHTIPPHGVLLLVGSDPFEDTEHPLAAGIRINQDTSPERREKKTGTLSRYYVDARLQLSDTEPSLLVLRNAENKKKTSENIVDLTGTLYIEDASTDFQTQLWPLVRASAGSDDVIRDLDEAFLAGKVYQRRKTKTGTSEHTWVSRFYTGVGYKRTAAKKAANGGTPGFPNDVIKDQTADLLEGATVSISEIMYTPGSSMPQWIELYNSSTTQAVRLRDWTLQFESAAGADVHNITLTLKENIIMPPNQPLLLVSTRTDRHSGHFPSSRIISLWGAYRSELKVADVGRRYTLLSPNAFRLTLREKGGSVVDVAGNLDDEGQPRWALPTSEAGNRSSILRVYDKTTGPRDGTLGVAGTAKPYGWVLASDRAAVAPQQLYYGHIDDQGSPGYRIGGALPVALSFFRSQRVQSGAVVLKWVTESELNNAGFNILRCETREGTFKQVNTSLIAGQGTTSDRTVYTWTDPTAKPDTFYYYQIEEVSLEGKRLTLATARLSGHISAAGKRITQWGALKQTSY